MFYSFPVLITLSVYNGLLCLFHKLFPKVYFVRYEYCCQLSCQFHFREISPSILSLLVSVSFNSKESLLNIDGPCFFIQSSPLCLLIGTFSPLTFKVIIYRYVHIAILLLVFWVIFFILCSFHLLLASFLVVWLFCLVVCLCYFLPIFVCLL